MKFVVPSLLILVSLFSCTESQTKLFGDMKGLTEQDEVSVICVPYYYSRNEDLKKYCFHIKNLEDLKSLNTKLITGSSNTFYSPSSKALNLATVNRKEISSSGCMIDIEEEVVLFNGYLDFDISQLERLHKEFPIDFEIENKTFRTEDEVAFFLSKYLNNDSLLCYDITVPQYDGRAEISFSSSVNISNQNQAVNYIIGELEKFGFKKEEDFLPGYNPDSTKNIFVLLNRDVYKSLTKVELDIGRFEKTPYSLILYWNASV